MESHLLTKISLQNNIPARVQITVSNNFIELIVLKNECAWKSLVSQEILVNYASQHKLDLEKYKLRLLEYVKRSNPNIIFTLNNNEFTVIQSLDNLLKVKFFTCKLEQVNYVEQVEVIMDQFYLQNAQLETKCNLVLKEKEELEIGKADLQRKLEELTKIKQSVEEKLFSDFVLILNEKKRQIQHLTEVLEAFKNGNRCIAAKENKKLECISESESSQNSNSDINTDDEENGQAIKEAPCINPSTSEADMFGFLADEDTDLNSEIPKRIKFEKSNIITTIANNSQSRQSTETMKSKASVRKPTAVDFDTQTLLDML